MITTRSYKLSFIILSFSAFISCRPKLTHTEAAKYYRSINDLTNRATQESSQYIIDQIDIDKSTTNNFQNYLDTANIELHKKRHQQFNDYLDSLLNVLNEIKEIDKTIKLKASAIAYINGQLEFHNMALQSTIETYSAYTSPSNNKKGSTLSISLATTKDNLDQRTSDLIESSTKFAIKYRLSVKELKNNGL